jgi:uncharacterized membrane protein
MKNFFIPVVTLLASTLILLYLRKKVVEVIADERDWQIGGKSALVAIQIYSWIAVITMFLLYSLRDINPYYEAVATTLAFSTCILMLLYSLIFKYYNKIKLTNKKSLYFIITTIVLVIMLLLTLRIFSGEDNWVCSNGQWVKHGQPDYPAPQIECK